MGRKKKDKHTGAIKNITVDVMSAGKENKNNRKYEDLGKAIAEPILHEIGKKSLWREVFTETHESQKPKLKQFMIPVNWSCGSEMIIEAYTKEEAIQKAYNADLPDGDYIDDSFEVIEEAVEEI